MANVKVEPIIVSDDDDDAISEVKPEVNDVEPTIVEAAISAVETIEEKPKYIRPEDLYSTLCYCDERFNIKTLKEYQTHLIKHHLHEGRFDCIHCELKHCIKRPEQARGYMRNDPTSIDALYVNEILNHLKCHSNNRFVCAQDGCNASEIDEAEIILHSINYHGGDEVVYEHICCMDECTWKKETKVCQFDCNLCDEKYSSAIDFNHHFELCHIRRVVDARIAMKTIKIGSSNPTDTNELNRAYRQTFFYYRSMHECACGLSGCYLKSLSRKNMFKQHLLTAKTVPGHDMRQLEFKVTRPTVLRIDPDEANILTEENKSFDFNFVYACVDDLCKLLYFESVDAVRKHFSNCHSDGSDQRFRYTIKSLITCFTFDQIHFGTFELIQKSFPNSKRKELLTRCGACSYQNYNESRDPINFLTDEELAQFINPVAPDFEFRVDAHCEKHQTNNRAYTNSYTEFSKHLSDCNITCTKQPKHGKLKKLEAKLSHMDVAFDNGFTVNFKCLLHTTFGIDTFELAKQGELRNNILFTGLDPSLLQQFDASLLFGKIATAIGFNLKRNDFDARLTKSSGRRVVYLVSEFCSPRVKENFKNIWRRKTCNQPLLVSHIFGNIILDNEIVARDHLTTLFLELFKVANKAQKDGKLFAVSFDGCLKVQKTSSASKVTITNRKRLEEIISGESTTSMEQRSTSSGYKRGISDGNTFGKKRIKTEKTMI